LSSGWKKQLHGKRAKKRFEKVVCMKTDVTQCAYNEIAEAFEQAGSAMAFQSVGGKVFVNFG